MCLDGAALPGDPVPHEFLGAVPPGDMGELLSGAGGSQKAAAAEGPSKKQG